MLNRPHITWDKGKKMMMIDVYIANFCYSFHSVAAQAVLAAGRGWMRGGKAPGGAVHAAKLRVVWLPYAAPR